VTFAQEFVTIKISFKLGEADCDSTDVSEAAVDDEVER
jgi:hypothetical protein